MELGATPGDTIRVARVIARMNVGGPAVEVTNLMRQLPAYGIEQTLLTGHVASDEADFLATQAPDVAAISVAGLGRALKPLDDIRAFFEVRAHLRRLRPHIVHTHTAKAGAIGRIAALTLHPRPRLVHTFHGHVLQGYFSTAANLVFGTIERVLGRVTDELVTVGPEVREELLAAGIGTPERFRVIEPGVSLQHTPSRADARAALALPDDAFVIAVVGRLTGIKRPDRMLDVIAAVADRIPGLVVLVAGSGDLADATATRASAERLPVRMLGWIDDVETVFAASDLALLTSDNEGTPISLIQAAMLGVPCVATDVGSVTHVVRDGETGWIVATDVPALASAVQSAAANHDERRRRGSAARDHVSDRYSVERFVQLHATLYREVMSGSTSGVGGPS